MTFRDEQPRCPVCADRALGPQPGHETRLRCDGCKGLLVPIAEVEEMIGQLEQKPWSFDEHARADASSVRTCPRCAAAMQPYLLFTVSIDRCALHGIWFDGTELAMVLEAASGVDPHLIDDGPQYSEMGPLAKLKAWFGSRHKSPQSPRRPKDE